MENNSQSTIKEKKGNKYLQNSLKITLSLALGVFIFWLAYRKMDLDKILGILKGDVVYGWILLSVAFGILSNFFRTWRWKMLIDVLDARSTSFFTVFYAVFIGYFANFLLPRAGEVIRCSVVNKYEGTSFTKVIGTMIAERAFDLIMLIIITIIAIVFQMDFFSDFFSQYSLALDGINKFLSSFWFLSSLFLLLFLLIIFRKQIKRSRFYGRVIDLFKNVLQGMKTFLFVRSKGWFTFHTVMIWVMYLAMLYVSVFAFDFTRGLSVWAILTVFVMASIALVIPVQGGIGTFHFMTILTLGFYGIGPDEAGAYALVVHGAQTLMFMLGGIVSLIGIQFITPKSPQ